MPVKNGGPSRKGEEPRTKESRNRYSGSRKLESIKKKGDSVATNVELKKDGVYKCGECKVVKPDQEFPSRVPTGKFSRFESCEECPDDY